MLQMIDGELETVRTTRAAIIDGALRRLVGDLQASIAREVDLMEKRERALVTDAEPVAAKQLFEALVPQCDATGRDPRGSFVIVRELIARAGARGMYQRDLDTQAEKFGFSHGAIARAKQRLRTEGIGTFDSRWRVWRLLTADERAAWETQQKAAAEAA